VNLLVTSVPRCICSNAKTLALKLPQFPDIVASGGPPDGARVVYQRTDKLLLQQNTIPDGETTSHHSQSLYRFLSGLIGMRRPGKPRIKVHPQDNGRYRPRGLAPRRVEVVAVSALAKSIAVIFETLIHSFSHRSGSQRCLQVLTNSAGCRYVATTAVSSA